MARENKENGSIRSVSTRHKPGKRDAEMKRKKRNPKNKRACGFVVG
jgi:hypothetical protein